MTRRQVAWILILIVDAAYIAWGAGAAIAPNHLLGPGGKAILPAGYEYPGLALVWGAFAITAPVRPAARLISATG